MRASGCRNGSMIAARLRRNEEKGPPAPPRAPAANGHAQSSSPENFTTLTPVEQGSSSKAISPFGTDSPVA